MKRIISILLAIALFLLPCALASNNYNAIFGSEILRRGSRGDSVRRLQQALIGLGYLSGGVDGSYGSGTEAAVRTFQRFNGIDQSGVATMFTQARLFGTDAVPIWQNPVSTLRPSGSYGVRNSSGRSYAMNQVTVSFDFVNQESRSVEAICVYYWLADYSNNLVNINNSTYWMQWVYGMSIPSQGTKTLTQTLNMSSSQYRKMSTVRCIVGEIVYTDGSIAINMNPYVDPYRNSNYILYQG